MNPSRPTMRLASLLLGTPFPNKTVFSPGYVAICVRHYSRVGRGRAGLRWVSQTDQSLQSGVSNGKLITDRRPAGPPTR